MNYKIEITELEKRIASNTKVLNGCMDTIKTDKTRLETLKAMIWNSPEHQAKLVADAAAKKEECRLRDLEIEKTGWDLVIRYFRDLGLTNRNGNQYDYSIFNQMTGIIIKNSESGQ